MNCYLHNKFIDTIQFEQIVLLVLMNCITVIDKCTYITLDKTGSWEIQKMAIIKSVYGYNQIFSCSHAVYKKVNFPV